MADQPLSPIEGPIASLPHSELPPGAVMRLFSTYEREQLASFVEVAIGLLDLADPDPDLEEDDPAGQCDEDGVNTDLLAPVGGGPGCLIGDSDFCLAGDDRVQSGPVMGGGVYDYHSQLAGNEDDAEREQMQGDVPTLPVFTAEHDLFNDKRTFVGMSNLTSSFVGEAVSADTGRKHRGRWARLPGVPV